MGIKQTETGFTIVELSMFIAIAGLLLVGMMSGISLAVNRQRFSDTINGTQSFLQLQFNEAQFVNNNRSTSTCIGGVGSSNCALIGRLIDFGPDNSSDESTIHAYDIISNAGIPTPTELDQRLNHSVLDVLNDNGVPTTQTPLNIQAIDNANKDTYIVPWGGLIKNQASPKPVYNRFLAIIQSPITGNTDIYGINSSINNPPTSSSPLTLGGNIQKYPLPGPAAASSTLCIHSQDLVAMRGTITINPLGTQDAVVSSFEGKDCS